MNGLNFLVTIDGEVSFTGCVTNSESTVWISARGSLTGTGFYSILDLTTRGWILMTAAGKAEEGEVVVLRFLLYDSRQSLVLLQV